VKQLSFYKEGLAKKRKIIGKAKYNDQVRFLLEGTFYAFNFKQDCKFTTSSEGYDLVRSLSDDALFLD
jgi:hypothetical protein